MSLKKYTHTTQLMKVMLDLKGQVEEANKMVDDSMLPGVDSWLRFKKQHNASVLADKIGMGINQRISGSRKADSKYENTLIIVNQPWVELPDNPFGQPKMKA